MRAGSPPSRGRQKLNAKLIGEVAQVARSKIDFDRRRTLAGAWTMLIRPCDVAGAQAALRGGELLWHRFRQALNLS